MGHTSIPESANMNKIFGGRYFLNFYSPSLIPYRWSYFMLKLVKLCDFMSENFMSFANLNSTKSAFDEIWFDKVCIRRNLIRRSLIRRSLIRRNLIRRNEPVPEGTLRAYRLFIRSICILIDEHGDFRLNFAITKLLVKWSSNFESFCE